MGNRTLKNATWIIGCKIVQAIMGLVVTMLSARFLGPSGFGIVNYAAAIVSFFVPVMQLGLNATLVQEIIDFPNQEGETLGTALLLSFISGIACIIGIVAFSAFANSGDTVTVVVCVLYSISLLFQSLEMIQYWFQAKLLSKYTSIAMLVSYLSVSAYKILLLINGVSIYWFAIAQAIDFAIISFSLFAVYRKIGVQPLRFSLIRARELIKRSKHYIVSGMMITVFSQTDKVMLKMIIDESAVGYYSAAMGCATMTTFVFVAIIDSARPTILEAKKKSNELFKERLSVLFAIVILLAFLQCVFITLLARFIMMIVYGKSYMLAVSTLQIVVWYTAFSYIGSVRDIWILSENKQKYLWVIYLIGAILNVIANAILIPLYGANGAAIASLLTQFFTNVITGFIIRPIRESNFILLSSLNPKYLVRALRMITINKTKE